MSNELLKKTYNHFGGVWPYGDKGGMVVSTSSDNLYGLCNCGKDILNSDEYHNKMWKWVGTKADFDAYGESLKGGKESTEEGEDND